MKNEILRLLDERKHEIAHLHAERVRTDVLAMRAFTVEHLEQSAVLMISLYVQHLRAEDSPLPMEVEFLSRDRAAFGIAPGDMVVGWLGCVRDAREVVLREISDDRLREGLAAWADVDRITATIIGWMVERHRKNLDATR